jgi:hypothetical protein
MSPRTWKSALDGAAAGHQFAELYRTSGGQLPDEVVDAYAQSFRRSSTAAGNAFLAIAATAVPDQLERARLIVRLGQGADGTRAGTPVQVRLDQPTLLLVDQLAEARGVTRSDMVRELLRTALESASVQQTRVAIQDRVNRELAGFLTGKTTAGQLGSWLRENESEITAETTDDETWELVKAGQEAVNLVAHGKTEAEARNHLISLLAGLRFLRTG